jgi:hypothetical protein
MNTVCNEINGIIINVGGMTSFEDGKYTTRFQPFKTYILKDKRMIIKHCEHYNEIIPGNNYDKLALEKGYSQIYYSRPSAFIDLKLSPRTRKYFKQFVGIEQVAKLFEYLKKTKYSSIEYLDKVQSADYFKNQLGKWIEYINQ